MKPRHVLILLGSLAAIAGSAWGSGAFGGTPITEAADGALAADATLLAPASPAFAIWTLIYAGLLAFAIYQALPAQRDNTRIASVGWFVLASLALNAAWIAVVQAGWLWVSVAVLVAIVVTLAAAAARLARSAPLTWPERLLVDVPVGLYVGWACVATIANVAAAGSASMADFDATVGRWFAVAALVVAAALSIMLARGLRGSTTLAIATCAALSWGLWWIAIGRITDEPRDLVVGWVAGLAAAIAVAAPFAVRDASYIGREDPLAPQ